MATLFIHVGLHKTGSTSIQSTLASLPEDRRPFLIGNAADPNVAGAVNAGFRTPRSGVVDEHMRERTRRRVRRALLASANRDAVISSEAFETLTAQEFHQFMRLVRHERVRIIAYVREPYGLTSSVMQQRIRGGTGYTTLKRLAVNYREALEKFERYDVDMVAFDRSVLLNGCVVQDFMARVGHPVSPDEVISQNEGLSRTAVALLFMRNRWRAANGLPPSSATPLLPLLPTIAGPKFRLHPRLIDRFLRRRSDDLAWAAERFGPRWVARTTPLPTDVASDADLLVVPEEAHAWLATHDASYARTDDPAAMGGAMERIHAVALAALERARLTSSVIPAAAASGTAGIAATGTSPEA